MVTRALCPINLRFSGSLGIASPAFEISSPTSPSMTFSFLTIVPPFFSKFCISIWCYSLVSASCLHCLSRSMTCFLSLAIDVHFLSKISLSRELGVFDAFKYPSKSTDASRANALADSSYFYFSKYSWMAKFRSSCCFGVKPTIIFLLRAL